MRLDYPQSYLPFTKVTHLCYTLTMVSNQHIWRVWAKKVHRWGLGTWTAALLEAVGPLAMFGAQAVYIAQPFVSSILPSDHLNALTDLLEQPDQTRAFITLLREEAPQ